MVANERTKLKKDTLIDCPNTLKEPFALRQTEISHEEDLLKVIEKRNRSP